MQEETCSSFTSSRLAEVSQDLQAGISGIVFSCLEFIALTGSEGESLLFGTLILTKFKRLQFITIVG